MADILEQRNFISERFCDRICSAVRVNSPRGVDRGAYHEVSATAIGSDLLVQRIVMALSQHYSADIQEDYAVYFQTRIGGYQPLHADAEKCEEGEWVPNHAHWRTHVGMLYLTTEGVDHEGGVLTLPTVNAEYRPERGLLVGFPATGEYIHAVSEVTSGERYALAVWTKAA